MPVDNDNIRAKIDALRIEGDKCQDKLREIRETIQNLMDIYEEIDPKDETGQTMKPIIDKTLGEVISTTRRQEIYDKLTAKATALLS